MRRTDKIRGCIGPGCGGLFDFGNVHQNGQRMVRELHKGPPGFGAGRELAQVFVLLAVQTEIFGDVKL